MRTKTLSWYEWALFSATVVIALAMSWYSVLDLSTTYLDLPYWLGATASTAFDVGAIFLGLMAIKVATSEDSGFWIELAAFSFVGVSIYINVQHAIVANYGMVGMVMFGAAPVVAGILLKVVLSYISRTARREAGLTVHRLPTVGFLTWIFFRRDTMSIMSLAMKTRLELAADKLDKQRPLVQGTLGQARDMSETSQEQKDMSLVPGNMSRTDVPVLETTKTKQLTSPGHLSLPVWLANEPTMSLATLVRTCLDNGVTDVETMYRYAKDIKGQDVNKMSLSKTIQRQKAKL